MFGTGCTAGLIYHSRPYDHIHLDGSVGILMQGYALIFKKYLEVQNATNY